MELNRIAKIIGNELQKKGVEIQHKDLLDLTAKSHGFKDWKDFSVEEKEFEISTEVSFTGSVNIMVKARSAIEALSIIHDHADAGNIEHKGMEIDDSYCEGISADNYIDPNEWECTPDYSVTDDQGKETIFTHDELETFNDENEKLKVVNE